MPPVNDGLLDGHLAWRQDDGGHTDAPNMKYFIQWVDKNIGYGTATSSKIDLQPSSARARIAALPTSRGSTWTAANSRGLPRLHSQPRVFAELFAQAPAPAKTCGLCCGRPRIDLGHLHARVLQFSDSEGHRSRHRSSGREGNEVRGYVRHPEELHLHLRAI